MAECFLVFLSARAHAHVIAHVHARFLLYYYLLVVVVVVGSVEMLNTMNFYPWNDILWLILMLILLWITC
nr:MAG TPA: hypothetical protein [Microviridae sp.]